MKIAAVEVIYTKPAWVFVKITTDTGLVGWGEASYGGRDRATGVAVEEASRYLIGTCVSQLGSCMVPKGFASCSPTIWMERRD
jgi:L-alanine-DL-glutamate epimerase-like enolase superfamily enzyme